MPYKIYTYTDPYKISQTDFWEEVKNYPHFCAARTMVNGLLSVMADDINALLCPLDDIVNDRIFNSWVNDIGLRIQQYSHLSSLYRKWKECNGLSENYYMALMHNKDEMLDALRLFIELDVNPDVLDTKEMNLEHKMFVYMLKKIRGHVLFRIPKMPSLDELKMHVYNQAVQEKLDKMELHKSNSDNNFVKKELLVIDRMISLAKHWDGMHIVVHGIHQFSPLQLRFLEYLNKLGVEIIFLHNYLPDFKEIYSSWSYIYQQFNAPIHHDKYIKSFNPTGQFPKIGNAIAENIGILSEEGASRADMKVRNNYSLYCHENVLEFDNISEYAGYISDIFVEAEHEMNNQMKLIKKSGTEKVGTAAVLARMEEIVYTANKDVDELLQVYHPEYARNRHFLAYPIGQFFAALYSLWNVERQEIDIKFSLLRECVNSGILSNYNSEQLLKTLMNVEPVFANIDTFSAFRRLFSERYLKYYDYVMRAPAQTVAAPLRMLSIYNSYKVTTNDLKELSNAVCEINKIATDLFAGDFNRFDFKKHFEQLSKFVREKNHVMADEEEKELIVKLLFKLECIHTMSNVGEGTFEDLRNGLYFFLKQKEKPVSDWFVKNFEQIDGDVLNSKRQNTYGEKKVYHFACVSDKDMNRSTDELLPWPLTESFIEKAYNPKDLPFQVYYAALGERSNFLRYALFYGLYFNYCDVKISFVKRYGSNTTDYYEMLKIIGLNKEDNSIHGDVDEYSTRTIVDAKEITSLAYNREHTIAMFYCPYKYLLDYVLNPQPSFSGIFLIQKYYENILIENVWKANAGKRVKDVEENLQKSVYQEAKKIGDYFSFLRDTELLDLQKRVENYFKTKVLETCNYQGTVRAFDDEHMKLRKIFGDALFKENIHNGVNYHPYQEYEEYASNQDGNRMYSAHKIPKEPNAKLLAKTLEYINKEDNNLERCGSWCTYCANKGICLQTYAYEKE